MGNVSKNGGEKIGLHQADEFIAKLEKAGLTIDLMQKVIASKNNALAGKMMAAISLEGSPIKDDSRFEKLAEFDIEIFGILSLDKFQSKNKKKFYGFNSDIKDQNFKPNQPLTLGTRKKVFVYQAKESMASEDYLNFIASQNGQLPNAQGLAMVWQQAKDKLPKGLWILGFDQKANLFLGSGGRHRVPSLYRHSDGSWHFHLGYFEDVWDSGDCLLFFRDC
jgi:hypothetical protein